ncbi:MAG: 1,6-anhydro-N-acetylmuramyl-L-alanine amidase AmpD [Pseudomonadales bacterium]|nr:1,6-anhydro-N-acetylmuramyl-L-alanine amidase AmpD [Pseudomonadales bacterium]
MKIDENGWLSGFDSVTHRLTPNQNDRPANTPISLLVVHGISLPPGQFGGQYIEDFFLNQLDPEQHSYFKSICEQQVSSHLLIKRDGEVVQFASFESRAWHAGASCFDQEVNCNDFSIGIELEGTDQLPYEEIQYNQLVAVTHALMAAYPQITTDRIVGHSDIAPGRKTDPGPGFDWNYFRALI